MKILKVEYLVKRGAFAESDHFQHIYYQVKKAIEFVRWPDNSDSFTIYAKKQANGVKPIKVRCMSFLKEQGWELEKRMELGTRLKPGPVDAVLNIPGIGDFAFEWETGNISSSHRALNKMALGLLDKKLVGGFLVVPSRTLYYYLTDRIGNFPEIEPYFPVWKNLKLTSGVLAVIEVEQDDSSLDVPKIPKGTDGRALK